VAGSSATVPIVVAIIGVMGAIIPIYINNVVTPGSDYPHVYVQLDPSERSEGGSSQWRMAIENNGNAPATNLSMSVRAFNNENILNITNSFSTADVILPKFSNTSLEPGANETINNPILEIYVPKLIHGGGSTILLETFINSSYEYPPLVYVLYDQGSSQVGGVLSVADHLTEFNRQYQAYYIIFYVVLFGLLFLYIRRRSSLKAFLTKVATNIMEIRKVLRSDSSNKSIFHEAWFQKSEKNRPDIQYIGDYLLIDDFYSELRRRNSYLRDSSIDETKVVELHWRCLEAAEKILKDVDWNKYR
jgi:hypothetical protein